LVKSQSIHDSLIDAMMKIIKKNGSKYTNLEKTSLRDILLLFAFMDAAGIAIADIIIPDELSESFNYELAEKYFQHQDVKFPDGTCTGHHKYLGDGDEFSNFDSIKSLKAYWDSKVKELHSVNFHFCELLADLLKISILVWVPYVNSPGVFRCLKVFGPQYPDFCFVAFFPYELNVNSLNTRTPGGVPQSWTMSKEDIESKPNFFCPIEMSATKMQIRERLTPLNNLDNNDRITDIDNNDRITDMTLFDYFNKADLRNNVYIHSSASASSSSELKNPISQQKGLSCIGIPLHSYYYFSFHIVTF
jgi:hypothetical protein